VQSAFTSIKHTKTWGKASLLFYCIANFSPISQQFVGLHFPTSSDKKWNTTQLATIVHSVALRSFVLIDLPVRAKITQILNSNTMKAKLIGKKTQLKKILVPQIKNF